MTRTVSPRLAAYAGLAGIGLLAGLVLGRVELIALAAPFALAAVAGAALAREPDLQAALMLERERALEDEDVIATVQLSSSSGADRVDVLLPLPRGLRAEKPNPRAVRLAAAETRTLEVPMRSTRCWHRTRRRRTSATRSRARRARAWSSPTSATGRPATAYGRSTGARAH